MHHTTDTGLILIMIVDISGVPKFALDKSRFAHEERTPRIFYHFQLALARYRSVAALICAQGSVRICRAQHSS